MAQSPFKGPLGPYVKVQFELANTAPDIACLLRQKAAAPIKPRKPQQPCDVGLFSDEADQLDLCEMFQDPADD